jgi:predicted ester cyclase
MTVTATPTTRQFIEAYFSSLSGKPKTAALIDQFTTDPLLKEHILGTEEAFPSYELETHEIVVEGEMAAVRATFHGVQKGEFAGIAATGKCVSAPVMIFYKVEGERVTQFWLQFDLALLMSQLTVN